MDFTRLTEFLEMLPEKKGIPGVDLIVKQGYETLYRHYCGYSDRENKIPMNGKESFFLYSSTKPLTCVAAMRLLEKGKFLLIDPLYEYIPEYRHMQIKRLLPNGTIVVEDAKNPITVGQLFSMTAGFQYDITKPSIQQAIQETNGRAPTVEVIRALAKTPLSYEPGTRWFYSLGHDVLGALVEVVSGKRFGAFMQEEILQPLGMDNTAFYTKNQLPENMMAQYFRNTETGAVDRIDLDNMYCLGTEYESGGAGLISTTDDYIRFAEAMANDGIGANGYRLLSKASIDLMRTNHLSPTQMDDFDWSHMHGYGYGLGVRTMVDPAKGGVLSPMGEFGWGGAAGTYVLMDPKNRISIFYTQHMLNNLEEFVQARIRNIVYSCL